MSIWDKIWGLKASVRVRDAEKFAFVDLEVGTSDKRILDIGVLRYDEGQYHGKLKDSALRMLKDIDYLCGHNIVHHDAKYLLGNDKIDVLLVDTLYMSPLLFPEHPYHRLLKNDKLQVDEINNPLNDCKKAKELLFEEINQWRSLSERLRKIYASLLQNMPEFTGFMSMVGAEKFDDELIDEIKAEFKGRICENADVDELVNSYPCELAYALALAGTTETKSITPGWLLHSFPNVEYVLTKLCGTICRQGCEYCRRQMDIHYNLKQFFDYDNFRTYEGEPLQEKAAHCAVEGKSLLAIFPTGGGKSLTFQLPALMAGRTVHGLTVVISPLQSLMKDQVDEMTSKGITDVATINGLLDPITKSAVIRQVRDGEVSLLYIAPEMLRSKTIERILMMRHVVRFVIDEAHCFSSWGQDFRVDYLYIGKFIREYQKKKNIKEAIPVSCFTATAKQKVIQDICDYFKKALDINFEIFATSATRTNLRYSVIHVDGDEDKYNKLRLIISASDCPVIVYVSRTRKTKDIASKLSRDGYSALPYNGKMNSDEKVSHQDAFMRNKVRIIVATSAFGMGVNKKDVGLVVHYDISDSLENYVQEAGRAGRDPHLEAKCYVLYGDNDLDKHFILLNQTKLSISEIQQVWRAVKGLTKNRLKVCSSALEIARRAGWDDSVSDIETRVRTALSALEQSGYIDRGTNVPHVYATGITVSNVEEARSRISSSKLFDGNETENVIRILRSLISQKYSSRGQEAESESRIDYLADTLGLEKRTVISAVERMRQEGILADSKDISAFLNDAGDSVRKSRANLDRFDKLEQYILRSIPEDSLIISYKQLNDNAVKDGITTSKEMDIRTLLYFLSVMRYTCKRGAVTRDISVSRCADVEVVIARQQKRIAICKFIIEWLYGLVKSKTVTDDQKASVQFSVVELLKQLKTDSHKLFEEDAELQIEDVEEALFYLSKIGALKLEGGFLVLYNAMSITRKKENKYSYKKEDYRLLDEFYKMKIQQVHIVGEYANLMVRDYDAALQYVKDYFQLDYKAFVNKYFKEERKKEISRNISPEKYRQLFDCLSAKQNEIISDKDSHCIVVAAGPGSGKTRVLVHKLASLLLLEDVKHEQLLMLTFSRAAATEFKQRLMGLIGNAAHFVEIKTFHSYCFDLLGRIGNLDDAKDVVEKAAMMINNGEVEPSRICKTVLVIDEAQDMGHKEYELVRALMNRNDDMRVIAVGDDDQNIFAFRGSDSRYMSDLRNRPNSKFYEMVENYRSSRSVVALSNSYVRFISHRMKTNPITSMSKENGWTEIVKYSCKCMYQPVVESIKKAANGGSISVLTQTNEQAVVMAALLRRNGLNCKLVQTLGTMRFSNLMEVRYFMKKLKSKNKTPLISEDVWNDAKRALFARYPDSLSMEYVKRCIYLFEQTNEKKYYSDFGDYIFESSVEDFFDSEDAEIIVSTIHKSKGREYDDVYMMIDSVRNDDNRQRLYYVGATRAKKRLFIHTTSNEFDGLPVDRCSRNDNFYTEPHEVALQLSYKGVYLDYSKGHQNEILALRSGDQLNYNSKDFTFADPKKGLSIAKLSKDAQKNILQWSEKGYHVTTSKIRFIVAWKPKNAPKDERETAVILLDLVLRRDERQ